MTQSSHIYCSCLQSAVSSLPPPPLQITFGHWDSLGCKLDGVARCALILLWCASHPQLFLRNEPSPVELSCSRLVLYASLFRDWDVSPG